MKIYLAGKIEKNDWWHRLVPDLRAVSTDDWWQTRALPMHSDLYADLPRNDTYVGPFFMSCDHGCGHGGNSYGAGRTCGMDNHSGDAQHAKVLLKSSEGIKACDLFIAWADENFSTAYGTMTEIGMARAWDKTIVFIRKTGVVLHDQWFSEECAGSLKFIADNPVIAVRSLLHVIKTLRSLNDFFRDGVDDIDIRYAVYLLNYLYGFRGEENEWKAETVRYEREMFQPEIDAHSLPKLPVSIEVKP